MSLKPIIASIRAAVQTKLIDTDTIEGFEVWRGQFENEEAGEEENIPDPVVYLKFADEMEWTKGGEGIKYSETVLTFKVSTDTRDINDEVIYDLVEKVEQALEGLSEDLLYTSLTKIVERPDQNRTNRVVHEIDFSTTLYDTSTYTRREYVSVSVTPEIESDLLITNFTVRTGDKIPE